MCRRVTTSNEWTQWTEKTQSRQLYTFDWGIQAAKWKHCHGTFSGPQTLNTFFVYLGNGMYATASIYRVDQKKLASQKI